jgi:hypothetical protein
MGYNRTKDVTAGYISPSHLKRLQAIMRQGRRGKRATLEWLIDQEYDKLPKEADNATT